MKHVTDLTSCRAFFAAWVFAYHLNLQTHYALFLGPVGAFVEQGALGVDGFFILSGMILAYAHADISPNFGEARAFWLKRLVRIYPVHIAVIVLMGAMVGSAYLLGLAPRDPGRFGLDELLRHLALVHAWGFSDRWAWNYPSWSISAEWAGYLVFPFLWPLVRRRRALGVAALLALALIGETVAQVLASREHLSLTYDGGLYRFFPEFVGGMTIIPLLARIERRVPDWAFLIPGGLCTVIGALAASEIGTIVGLWLILCGMLLRARQKRRPLLGWAPVLVWLGEISYAYYMSFAPVETLQATLWRSLNVSPMHERLLYCATTTALTFGLGVLNWAVVEQPSLRALAAVRRRRRKLQPTMS